MSDVTAVPSWASGADVTVVVPTLNAERTLSACLRSLRMQSHPCRIVVVDNGSTDGTWEIASAIADEVLQAGPERSAQRNRGARSFPAPTVGFIDADMVLQPTVVAEAVAALGEGAGSVIVPERTVGHGYWVGVRAFERSFYDGSDDIEAARFFRWEIFEQAGGFDEDLTGGEDWDLSESARRFAPVARTIAVIEHDEGSIGYLGACRKKAHYAEGVRRYVVKRGLAAIRQAGRRPWMRQPRRLLNRYGAGLIALKAGEAVAVGVALVVARQKPGAGTTGGVDERSTPPGPARGFVGLSGTVKGARRLRNACLLALRLLATLDRPLRTLTQMSLGMFWPQRTRDVALATKDGMTLASPAREYHWWPLIEVVVDDCYRLRQMVPSLGSSVRVLDIGAHVGAFSVFLAKLAPGAVVTAFEPSGERAAYLKRNIGANGLTGRVTVVQAAVGATGGRRALIDGVVSSEDDATAIGAEVVDVVGFEDAVRRVGGTVDILKLDCEGSEYEIVASVSRGTLECIDRILLEYHPAPADRRAALFLALQAAGFEERWRASDPDGGVGVVYLERGDQ